MADRALIQGAKELAASEGFIDYASSFSKSFDTEGRKARKEKEILEINNKVSEYYDTVDLDVDLSGFSPESRNLYEQQLIKYKDQVYKNATSLANTDASDPAYLEYKSELNTINSSVSNMAAQADLLKQLTSEYRTINSSGKDGLGGFSVGADPADVEDMKKIFLDKSVPLQSDDKGNLYYNVDGKKYSIKDFKMPLMPAAGEAKQIIDKNSEYSQLGRPLTPQNILALKNQYTDLIPSRDILASLLSADFKDIPTEKIDLDDYDNWEDARDVFINMLAVANTEAAANSVKYVTGDATSAQRNRASQVAALSEAFVAGNPIIRSKVKFVVVAPTGGKSASGPNQQPKSYKRFDLDQFGRWVENYEAGLYTDPRRIAGDLGITY